MTPPKQVELKEEKRLMHAADPSFDRDDPQRKRFEEEKLPKPRDQEQARAVATPTDFAVDCGKGHKLSPSFDASNCECMFVSCVAIGQLITQQRPRDNEMIVMIVPGTFLLYLKKWEGMC